MTADPFVTALSNIRFDYDRNKIRPAIACYEVAAPLTDDLKAKVVGSSIPGWFYVSRKSPVFEKVPTT